MGNTINGYKWAYSYWKAGVYAKPIEHDKPYHDPNDKECNRRMIDMENGTIEISKSIGDGYVKNFYCDVYYKV